MELRDSEFRPRPPADGMALQVSSPTPPRSRNPDLFFRSEVNTFPLPLVRFLLPPYGFEICLNGHEIFIAPSSFHCF